MEWAELILAAVIGLGVGNLWERRHASREAEKQRTHASNEARAAREHTTAEARATRRFELRLAAYREASQFLARQEFWIGLSASGVDVDAPEEAPEFGGTIAVTASDAVRAVMRAAVEAILAFEDAVGQHRRSPSTKLKVDMQEARERALSAIERAQTVMRDELEKL